MVKNWVKSQLVKVSAHLIVPIEILHLRSIGDISIDEKTLGRFR